MLKGQFKIQDLNEIRECVDCKKRKIVTDFVKGLGNLYRYKCKECRGNQRRTGKISQTRFKPGHDKGLRFEKGHTPWHKGKKGLNVSDEAKTKEHRFQSWQYNRWRESVFENSGNKCQRCSSTERLAAHHIKAWKDHFELRFEVSNGMALCVRCHAKEEGFQKGMVPWNKKQEH